jgi:hypothetical protein
MRRCLGDGGSLTWSYTGYLYCEQIKLGLLLVDRVYP